MLSNYGRSGRNPPPFPITRKAAIGFILLALIVFPTAYFSWSAPVPPTEPATPNFQQFAHKDNSVSTTMKYRPPLVKTDSPEQMGIIVTAIIEIFALGCYLVLKKAEPAINAWAVTEMTRLRENRGALDDNGE